MDSPDIDCLPSPSEIEHAAPSQLRIWYQQLIRNAPPSKASSVFLRGNLSWTIQAIEAGQDPCKLRASLRRLASNGSKDSRSQHKAGTRLIREWQGQTYEVRILEQGYQWNNQHYSSLSRIAEEITGAHWSGPRFFGLKETTK